MKLTRHRVTGWARLLHVLMYWTGVTCRLHRVNSDAIDWKACWCRWKMCRPVREQSQSEGISGKMAILPCSYLPPQPTKKTY